MTIAAVECTRVERVLRAPLATARGRIPGRPGFVVRLRDDAGNVGLGEATPLPGPDAAGLAAIARALDRLGEALVGEAPERGRARLVASWREGVEETRAPARRAAWNAAAWALDTALVDLASKRAGLPAADWLAGSRSAAHRVATNALLVAQEPAALEVEAAAAAARGERVLKLKVGGGSLARDADRVHAARSGAGASVRLRLDANAAWDVDEALRRIAALRRLDLEYVEQPVAAGNLEGLARVRRRAGVAIAADESAREAASARRVLARRAADVLALKPAALGPLETASDLAREAREQGVAVVFTSALDGAVSVAAAVHLAAALRLERACGLATAGLLRGDPVAPLPCVGGAVAVPRRAGLGLEAPTAASAGAEARP